MSNFDLYLAEPGLDTPEPQDYRKRHIILRRSHPGDTTIDPQDRKTNKPPLHLRHANLFDRYAKGNPPLQIKYKQQQPPQREVPRDAEARFLARPIDHPASGPKATGGCDERNGAPDQYLSKPGANHARRARRTERPLGFQQHGDQPDGHVALRWSSTRPGRQQDQSLAGICRGLHPLFAHTGKTGPVDIVAIFAPA